MNLQSKLENTLKNSSIVRETITKVENTRRGVKQIKLFLFVLLGVLCLTIVLLVILIVLIIKLLKISRQP